MTALNRVPGAPDLGDPEDDDGRMLVRARQVRLGEGDLLDGLPGPDIARRVHLWQL